MPGPHCSLTAHLAGNTARLTGTVQAAFVFQRVAGRDRSQSREGHPNTSFSKQRAASGPKITKIIHFFCITSQIHKIPLSTHSQVSGKFFARLNGGTWDPQYNMTGQLRDKTRRLGTNSVAFTSNKTRDIQTSLRLCN